MRVARALLAALPRGGFWRALAAFARDLPPRPDAQPRPPFRPGAGAGRGVAGRRRMAARAFHPYAGLGDPLCQPAARHAMDLLGPRQGYLDLAGLGACGQARHGRLDRDLHPDRLRSSAQAGRWPLGTCISAITASISTASVLSRAGRRVRDGSDAAAPVQILSVGRAVEKKGYDTLLQALGAAASRICTGASSISAAASSLARLKVQAERLGICATGSSGKARWRRRRC